MRHSFALLAVALRFLIPVAVLSTTYLYLYPLFHACRFPATAQGGGGIAPFRLLALADPQLEGDTSLPDPVAPLFPHLEELVAALRGLRTQPLSLGSVRAGEDGPVEEDDTEEGAGTDGREELKGVRDALRGLLLEDLGKLVRGYRKRLDLLGNDFYLAHVFRSVHWWTRPTHVVVLGDLLGSQWIDDDEFERRAGRYWGSVFKGARKLGIDREGEGAKAGGLGLQEVDWSRTLINVAGNHDIGYAGDINKERIERFEREFGKVNWNVSFELDKISGELLPASGRDAGGPRLDLVVLNSMNLDGPAWDEELREHSLAFLERQAHHAKRQTSANAKRATVLLTHIPLFKKEGICVDGPFWTYFPESQGGGVHEQNHLGMETSGRILDGLYRRGEMDHRSGVILNGHDHEGCDVWHSLDGKVSKQDANVSRINDWFSRRRYVTDGVDATSPGIREITVRSMMGDFGGNAGLLSGWVDETSLEWRFEYSHCRLGVQHIWWAVHVLDMVVLGVIALMIPLSFFGRRRLEAKSVHTKKTQ